jgi:uncharacterized protein
VISEGRDGLYLRVHAQPGAKKAALRGLHGDAVKVAVKEEAQDGKANAAIAAFVAKALGLPKSDVEVTSGHTSRSKRLFIRGDAADLRHRIESWLA